jgi:hypothetical protein
MFVFLLKAIASTRPGCEDVMFIAGADPSRAWGRLGQLHRIPPLAIATRADQHEQEKQSLSPIIGCMGTS